MITWNSFRTTPNFNLAMIMTQTAFEVYFILLIAVEISLYIVNLIFNRILINMLLITWWNSITPAGRFGRVCHVLTAFATFREY